MSAVEPARTGRTKQAAGKLRQAWWTCSALWQGCHRIRGWLDHGFYLEQVGPLPAGVSPEQHYLKHGWREERKPHPLFDPAHYRLACLQVGLPLPQGAPLVHFLRQGCRSGLLPSPLVETSCWLQQPQSQLLQQAPSLANVHPLGHWALALCDQDQRRSAQLLRQWQKRGLAAEDLRAIEQRAHPLAAAAAIPDQQPLHVQGSLLEWSTHAWLQHLPVASLQQLEPLLQPCGAPDADTPHTLVLLAETPATLEVSTLLQWWRRCSAAQQVIVQAEGLGRLLQGMGIPAIQVLQPDEPGNGWLEPASVLRQASADLGLPPPSGLADVKPVVLGEAGAAWLISLTDRLHALPGWYHLYIQHPSQARAQAAWLLALQRHQHPLLLLNPPDAGQVRRALTALQSSDHNHRAEALVLLGSFTENNLISELAWHQAGCPAPELPITAQPSWELISSYQATPLKPARVSVCISLHNYGHTITRALNSVRNQSLDLSTVELIIVDDCSSDQGANCVASWMHNHGALFRRCLLLQHTQNGGLASARNTAFQEAEAPWCFVLDADNSLKPEALIRCLTVAEHSDTRTAVVHPGIALEHEDMNGVRSRLGLHSIALWQKQRFRHGNHIDAMALVRKSAWQDIGGYQHIPGGWEDYDFWCSLIEAGWHGVTCPQVVTTYIAHGNSMLATRTNQNLRSLCRLLQARHPWLELDIDGANPTGGAHQA